MAAGGGRQEAGGRVRDPGRSWGRGARPRADLSALEMTLERSVSMMSASAFKPYDESYFVVLECSNSLPDFLVGTYTPDR